MAGNSGAYLLVIELSESVQLNIGRLGAHHLPAGSYVYIGSARRGLTQRVARHARLGASKRGRLHWHIDYLLVHPSSWLRATEALPGADECRLSHALAERAGTSVPVAGFGASDCRHGCPAHLYHLSHSHPDAYPTSGSSAGVLAFILPPSKH